MQHLHLQTRHFVPLLCRCGGWTDGRTAAPRRLDDRPNPGPLAAPARRAPLPPNTPHHARNPPPSRPPAGRGRTQTAAPSTERRTDAGAGRARGGAARPRGLRVCSFRRSRRRSLARPSPHPTTLTPFPLSRLSSPRFPDCGDPSIRRPFARVRACRARSAERRRGPATVDRVRGCCSIRAGVRRSRRAAGPEEGSERGPRTGEGGGARPARERCPGGEGRGGERAPGRRRAESRGRSVALVETTGAGGLTCRQFAYHLPGAFAWRFGARSGRDFRALKSTKTHLRKRTTGRARKRTGSP